MFNVNIKFKLIKLTRDISTNMKRTKNDGSVQDLPLTGPLKLAYTN